VLCAKVASVSSGESLLTCAFTLQLNPPRKSAAPAFATNLGLLEPKKAVPDPFASAGVDSAVPSGNLPFSTVSQQQQPTI